MSKPTIRFNVTYSDKNGRIHKNQTMYATSYTEIKERLASMGDTFISAKPVGRGLAKVFNDPD